MVVWTLIGTAMVFFGLVAFRELRNAPVIDDEPDMARLMLRAAWHREHLEAIEKDLLELSRVEDPIHKIRSVHAVVWNHSLEASWNVD